MMFTTQTRFCVLLNTVGMAGSGHAMHTNHQQPPPHWHSDFLSYCCIQTPVIHWLICINSANAMQWSQLRRYCD